MPAPFCNCDAVVASVPAPCCNCSIAVNSAAVAAVPPSVTFCCAGPNIENASLSQQKKLQNMYLHVPSQVADRMAMSNSETSRCLFPEVSTQDSGSFEALKLDEEPAALPKEKKGRGSPPMWHVTGSELDSLSAYFQLFETSSPLRRP